MEGFSLNYRLTGMYQLADATGTITIQNYGSGTLRIIGITTSSRNQFYQWNDCGSQVPGAGSCTITVYFTPGAVGQTMGYLTIFDNAQASPQIVALYGRGVQ